MQIPVLFSIVIIFVVWLQVEIRKSNKQSKKTSDHFWHIENSANATRKVDISFLNYIKIPIEQLPMSDKADATLNSYRDLILSLNEKKILNLTGITNTELKLKYGAANITLLSEADNNYTTLVSILHRWGDRLYTLGYRSDAVNVLEYAVTCSTDVRKTYQLLKKIYMEENTPEKIDFLIERLRKTNIYNKDAILHELTHVRISE
ncbi:hypothetical protein I5677_07595 [Mobilitalea sibirica]|uniref:Uncharacterized protein n=1 Tax=Mobilitalea sibirica TaxID=1462919 RepID=A0A8J7HC91_9FIRM|nr:hypothetical protein [Mobilitalea sibirica]MBH1940747.1 hypothetical protein [Mobilitalea sibirica]